MQSILLLTNADRETAAGLVTLLADNGYDVLVKKTVSDWQDLSLKPHISLALIYQELPLDHFETCQQIRNSSNVPIILLNSKADTFHKVLALETGADDYLTAPYERLELVARIRALLRRSRTDEDGNHFARRSSATDQIVIGPSKVDFKPIKSLDDDEPVGLAPKLPAWITGRGVEAA